MALEAQEIAVRLRLLNGTAFQAEADKSAESLRGIGKAGADANAEIDASGGAGGLGFLGNASKNLDAVNGKLDSFAKKSLHIGRQTAALSVGAGALIYESVKERSEAEAQFKLLETQAHATVRQRKELEATVPKFGKLAVGPTELAEAYYPIQSVFHSVTTDIQAMTAVAKGAAIGHDTQKNTAEALVSAYRTGAKDVHSFAEEMALLDETVGAGKMHLPELNEGFTTGTFQVATALHLSQRDVLAALAAESQTTAFGGVDQFLTRFRTTILKGIGLKGAALAAAKKLGIGKDEVGEDFLKSEQSKGKVDGFILLLRQLEEGRKKLGPQEGNDAISAMFGGSRTAGLIISALTKLHTDEEIRARLGGVHGSKTLNTHFKQTKETAAFQLKELKAGVKDLFYELGQSFTPEALKVLRGLVDVLHGMVKGFNGLPKPVKLALTGFIVFAAVLAPVAFLFSGIATAVRILLMPLGALGGAMGLFSTVEGPAFAFAVGTTIRGAVIAFAGVIAPGAAVYLGLEALNRLLGGQHSILSDVIQGWKNLGHIFSTVFGGESTSEGGKAEKRFLKHDKTKKAWNEYANRQENVLGNRPFMHPHSGIERFADREAEREAAGKKIDIHIHSKVVLPNGKVLAESVEKVQRNRENRR